MKHNLIFPFGDSWNDFEKTIYTPKELAASDLRVALASEIIKARQERGTLKSKAQPTEK